MTWIRSHTELRDHPKSKKAARLLGVSVAQVIGHLHMLWWWASTYAPDGNLSDYTPDDIADAAGWDGDPEKFIAGLVECRFGTKIGFLEYDENHDLVIHDWDQHGGKDIERQKADAERQRRYRERIKTDVEDDRPHDVTVTSASRDHDVTGERRGEEKRGEERRGEKEGGFSDEETPSDESLPGGDSDSAPPSPSCPIRKIVEIYHEKCPALPRVKAMHKAREEMLRTRWREDEDRQNLDFWGAFFSSVAASDFLCGRATPKPGKAPFVADFEWLIRPQNFAKVLEGKYDTESKVAPDVPYDDIMRLWNSIVAASGKKPGISEMHSLRREAVARIWNGVPSWGKIESWEKFFVWLSRYPGFMDLKNCGFDWLLQYDNFVKVREATYGA